MEKELWTWSSLGRLAGKFAFTSVKKSEFLSRVILWSILTAWLIYKREFTVSTGDEREQRSETWPQVETD